MSREEAKARRARQGSTEATTREAREDSIRSTTWTPPNALETPPPPEGCEYRWVRYRIQGEDDVQNLLSRTRNGYEIVKAEEIPVGFGYVALNGSRYDGAIAVGDVLLMKVSSEIKAQRADYFAEKTNKLQRAVDTELDRKDSDLMPISRRHRSSVSLGSGQPNIEDD